MMLKDILRCPIMSDIMKRILALIIGLGLILTAVPACAADSGGSSGEYIVYCNIDGAEVYFDDAYKGFISGGELKVPVNPSDKPYTTYLVKKDGYTPFTTQISGYPASGQTVKLYSTLTPSGTQHAIPSTPVSPITILTGIALVFLGFACLSKRE